MHSLGCSPEFASTTITRPGGVDEFSSIRLPLRCNPFLISVLRASPWAMNGVRLRRNKTATISIAN